MSTSKEVIGRRCLAMSENILATYYTTKNKMRFCASGQDCLVFSLQSTTYIFLSITDSAQFIAKAWAWQIINLWIIQ